MEWLEAKQQRNVNKLFIESIGSTDGFVGVDGAGQPMTVRAVSDVQRGL